MESHYVALPLLNDDSAVHHPCSQHGTARCLINYMQDIHILL